MKPSNTGSVSHLIYPGTLLPPAVPAGYDQALAAVGAQASPRRHLLAALPVGAVRRSRQGMLRRKEAGK